MPSLSICFNLYFIFEECAKLARSSSNAYCFGEFEISVLIKLKKDIEQKAYELAVKKFNEQFNFEAIDFYTMYLKRVEKNRRGWSSIAAFNCRKSAF